jgi:hypothetical protein
LAKNFQDAEAVSLPLNFESRANTLLSAIFTTSNGRRFAACRREALGEIWDSSPPETLDGSVESYSARDKEKEVIDYPGAASARFNPHARHDSPSFGVMTKYAKDMIRPLRDANVADTPVGVDCAATATCFAL